MADVSFDSLVHAIMQQESGGRNVNSTNPETGKPIAFGPMQITPATWQTYAKMGEDIHNPTDNMIVGRRILARLGTLTNWDAHKMAQGYFAGPGGIGSDRKDALGQSTHAYADQIMGRLGAKKEAAGMQPATFHVIR